ncbi:semaphorin-3F-like [Chelonoidis abingdonii]|uniref:semaphorin-3F-like n=1 Tax=Chelonoidis abingdonii TaxID=106734 RepID=UPI003F491DDA
MVRIRPIPVLVERVWGQPRSPPRSVFKGSAVCVYSMADIRMVLNGPFAHKEGPNYQWMPYTGKMPYPHLGTCPGGTFTPSMKSTKDYPDEVISFMRSHPLMYHAVYPMHRQPLVVPSNVHYKFTTVAVDQVDAADGRYEVLFLGTGDIRSQVWHTLIGPY